MAYAYVISVNQLQVLRFRSMLKIFNVKMKHFEAHLMVSSIEVDSKVSEWSLIFVCFVLFSIRVTMAYCKAVKTVSLWCES